MKTLAFSTGKSNKTMEPLFKKKDLWIYLLILILIGFLASYWFFNREINADQVEVIQAGKVIAVYDLNEDKTRVIKSKYGYNTLVIKNAQVWIKDADCPNQICVKQGKIQKGNESIACLPHRLIIRIKGGGGHDALSH